MAASPQTRTFCLGFIGEMTDAMVAKIAMAMNAACNGGEFDEIYFCFSTHGGFVNSGVYLYNHIRALRLPVAIHNTASVHSIGLPVFLAANARYCSKTATFMTHATTASPLAGSSDRKLQSTRVAVQLDEDRTTSILRERAHMPERIFRSRKFDDVHISPDQALAFGIVQEIREFVVPASTTQIVQIAP